MDLYRKVITITGGGGFLGTHVAQQLIKMGFKNNGTPQPTADNVIIQQPGTFTICRSKDYDLTTENDVYRYYENARPDIVIHLAAVVGGIGINRQKPGTFYYKNLMMGALLLEHARRNKVAKFVAVGSICSYPKFTKIPFREEDIWEGYPEETNAPYGIAKKAMLVQAQAYRQEFGLNTIYLLPVNLYGPLDNFNPESSHVIPAIIKKCIDARTENKKSITCWGTGTATREFLYVKDAAQAITLATEKYNSGEPVNIGSGTEISIQELVELIIKLTKYNGTITWDKSYPDGQPRRCLDTQKAKQFGFSATTKFEDGLAETIEWYEQSQTTNKTK
jgi:GDP-L-fucose synthase